MKKSFLRRNRRWLIIVGPSGIFLLIYVLLSVVFVNTTDNHLLTTNSRETRGHDSEPDLYNRIVNYFYRKLIVVDDDQRAAKPPPAADSVLVKAPVQILDTKQKRNP